MPYKDSIPVTVVLGSFQFTEPFGVYLYDSLSLSAATVTAPNQDKRGVCSACGVT